MLRARIEGQRTDSRPQKQTVSIGTSDTRASVPKVCQALQSLSPSSPNSSRTPKAKNPVTKPLPPPYPTHPKQPVKHCERGWTLRDAHVCKKTHLELSLMRQHFLTRQPGAVGKASLQVFEFQIGIFTENVSGGELLRHQVQHQ